jgi:hypothetical protein
VSWRGKGRGLSGGSGSASRPQCSALSRLAIATLAIALVLLVSLVPAAAERRNGAGLVVRHGDGTLIYAYVEFDEESISGIDLLVRSNLDLVVAPYGGLGEAVCRLDGEGCPADNCWCESFGNPSYFWHYYARADGGWSELIQGAASRTLHDGDIDGWSWTAGDSGLPDVTIDEIALMNGIDRNAPTPTPTPSPTVPPTEGPPTATPEPPTATPEPPTPTTPPNPTAATTPSVAPTASAGPASQAANAPSPTPSTAARATRASPSPTTPPSSSATIPRAPASPSGSAEIARAEPSPSPAATSLAVKVAPGGTPVPLDLSRDDGGGSNAEYIVFAAMAAVVLAAGGVVALRGRRGM